MTSGEAASCTGAHGICHFLHTLNSKTCQGWRFSGCSMHFYITLPMHNPDCSLLRLV